MQLSYHWCSLLLFNFPHEFQSLQVATIVLESRPYGLGQPGGRLAEWLRHWTLNHEIVGSSPAVRLVFCT